MGKKGYFFTVDAFIAMGVLAVGLFLVISFRSSDAPILQTTFYSNDITNLFASTELLAINNRSIDELRQDGNITNPRYTVLEQLGEFVYLNKTGIAKDLIINLSAGTVGEAFSFAILVEHQVLFQTDPTIDASDDLFSSKKIISGITNDSVMWGPYLGEVRVWR